MGASKFQMSLASLAASQGIKIDASAAFCEKVIKAYREKNARIKAHWYASERAALNAMQSGGQHQVGPFIYYRKGDWLFCRMPAGRSIAYYKPTVIAGEYGPQITYLKVDVSGKLTKNHTYGGSLVENNTQANCRDLLVDAMSRLERNGYTVIMSVHDEVVCEVDEDFGSAHEVEQIMSEVPEWAKGFPIAAEGFECRRYRK